MGLETSTYIDGLVTTNPLDGDQKAAGAGHLRLLKSTIKATFPNVTGAVTPTHTVLNYMLGVTSAVQTQLDAKGAKAGQVWTGAHDFTGGTPTVPTATVGDSSTKAASTAFVAAAAFSAALPSQTGNAGKFLTTDGSTASFADAFTGTAKATIELLTGANIASAATVNLDTATGNRVHITGTTTITAVTLTRGPRTVIFDGVLTLTHHATNNNLPGAANITTAAGDRAIYESDGTTSYCIAYTRKDGTSVASSGAGNHEVWVTTGNGNGSTNTRIRRFTTTITNVGTAITYADSATLGATFTINETGIYSIQYSESGIGSGEGWGASLNSTQLSTSMPSITAADRLFFVMASNDVYQGTSSVGRTVRLAAGDVVRPHTDATALPDGGTKTMFTIRKVGNV